MNVCRVIFIITVSFFLASCFQDAEVKTTLGASSMNTTLTAYDVYPPSFSEDTESIIFLSYFDTESVNASSCSIIYTYGSYVSTPCSCDSNGLCSVGITGNADFYGSAGFFTYRVNNGLNSNLAMGFLDITGVNDVPSISASCSNSVTVGSGYTCSPSGYDADGDTMIWSLSASNTCAWATINATTGAVSGTLPFTPGSCNLSFKVSDGPLTSSDHTTTVTINPGPADLSQSTLSVSASTLLSGNSVALTLTTKDIYGNNLTSGGYTVDFIHSSGAGESQGTFGATTDAANGSYFANFTGTVAGSATTITARINGSYVVNTTSVQVNAPASLSITGVNPYDFGSISSLSTSNVTLTLQNTGSVSATSISSVFADGTKFAFTGSGFPGTNGDCSTTLGSAATCTIELKFMPNAATVFNDTLTFTYNNGVTSSAQYDLDLEGTGTSGVEAVTVSSVYPAAGNWGYYINNNGVDAYTADNTICTYPNNDYHTACIHSGEKRKVTVTSRTSCSNISINEQLNLFDWECKVGSGEITFYTKQLKVGKGLKDLLDSGGAWRLNRIDILDGATTIASSTLQPWWTNPTSALSNNTSAQVNLSADGTVYFASSDVQNIGYFIAADNVSLVTLNGAKLKYNSGADITPCSTIGGNVAAIICAQAIRRAAWIEADMDSTLSTFKAHIGIFAGNFRYSRIQNLNIQDLNPSVAHYALAMTSSSSQSGSNLVRDVGIANASGGVEVKNLDYNTFENIKVTRIQGLGGSVSNCGIYLSSTSAKNKFYKSHIAEVKGTDIGGAADGGLCVNSPNNSFVGLKIMNIANYGVVLNGGGSYTSISQMILTNISNHGVFLNGGSNSVISHSTLGNLTGSAFYFQGGGINNLTLHSIAAANMSDGIAKLSTSTGSGHLYSSLALTNYTGSFIDFPVSGSNISGSFENFLNAGVSPFCNDQAGSTNITSSACDYGGGSAIQNDIGNDFLGRVILDDTINSADTNGSISYSILSLGSVSQWFDFENLFRTIGKLSSVLDSTSQGRCVSGTCGIWDWRLSVSSTALLNRSGDGLNSNSTFISGSCDGEVDGATRYITAPNGTTFMRSAFEIYGDDIGNDNGLCEQNEDCIYAPNVGMYQGHGNYVSHNVICTTTGTMSGIKIFEYPSNGI